MEKKRFVVCLLCMCCLATSVTVGAEPQDIATAAFKLRMTGQLDEAMVILEEAVSNNPSDARAQYELARVYFHRGLGPPQKMADMLAKSHEAVEKAISAAPNEVACHMFSGHVAFMRGYLNLMTRGDKPVTKAYFENASEGFESAIRLKPDYKQAMLYLVELHGEMPEGMGPNKAMAEKYAGQLETLDTVFAAKASAILSSKDTAFWENVLKRHPANADLLEELGKAHLKDDNIEKAVSCFEEAVKNNPQKSYLFLDLSIFHTFSAMRARSDQTLMKEHATSGDAAVTRYLDSKPSQPMQAYALGVQSKYQSHLGHRKEGKTLFEKAKTLDPYFSKATGCPIPDLFIPPGTISKTHRYLGRPY